MKSRSRYVALAVLVFYLISLVFPFWGLAVTHANPTPLPEPTPLPDPTPLRSQRRYRIQHRYRIQRRYQSQRPFLIKNRPRTKNSLRRMKRIMILLLINQDGKLLSGRLRI